MISANCSTGGSLIGRRRTFWATIGDACGSRISDCGEECGVPGLAWTDVPEGRTIDTDNWLRGLILNIILTDGRVDDSRCGHNPNAVKGHWADSYRDDGQRAGTRLRNIDFKGMSVNQIVATINAVLSSDMQKLVRTGVASDVKVVSQYAGNYSVFSEIEPFTPEAGMSMGKVAITGSRSNRGWMWS